MPVSPVSEDNISSTFEKNSGNLMDSIWYGALYQKMEFFNAYAEDLEGYTDDQKSSIGFSEGVEHKTVEALKRETANVHLRDGNFKAFLDCAGEIYRANNRAAVENDALYRQILDSLPEDEPYREEKAGYLFNDTGIKDNLFRQYSELLLTEFSFRMMRGAQDIIDGQTHGGDPKQATVGEVLGRLGLDEAEQQAFIQKYGYESPDQSLYQHYVEHHPRETGKPLAEIMNNAKSQLELCLDREAADIITAKLDADMSPDERQHLHDWRKRETQLAVSEEEENRKIGDWIRKKGKRLSDDLHKAYSAVMMQRCRLTLEGDKSLNSISANAPLQNVLDRQAEDSAYIREIIQGTRTADDVILDCMQKGEKALSGLERRSAEAFINDVRIGFRDDAFDKTDEDYPARQFADIFAARILSDSVRGQRNTLGTDFLRSDLDALSGKLTDNFHFRRFIDVTYLGGEDEGNRKLKDTAHKLYSIRTHGGFIEDEFKKYLLKLPAGELDNAPELARFMPTAGERIEELKRQVKEAPGDLLLQEKAAAEIIAIRNACQVERNTGYGLKKRIPAAAEGKGLAEEAGRLRENGECREILRDESTRKDLLSRGHGGKMMENVRKKYGTEVPAEDRQPAVESMLKRNTTGGRMAELRLEAQTIREQLESPNTLVRSQAMAKSKALLGEYMVLADRSRNEAEADAPWKTVSAMSKSAMNDPYAQKIMETPEKVSQMMGAIASGDIGIFQNRLTQEMNALKAANAPTVPLEVQHGNNLEGPGKQVPQGPVA